MQKQHKQDDKLSKIETSIRRWQTRLKIAVNKIDKLERQRRRLLSPKLAKTRTKAEAMADLVQAVDDRLSEIASPTKPLDIPKEFDRSIPVVAEEMTKARKAAEAEARKKMPVSDKQAAKLIRKKTGTKVSASLTR